MFQTRQSCLCGLEPIYALHGHIFSTTNALLCCVLCTVIKQVDSLKLLALKRHVTDRAESWRLFSVSGRAVGLVIAVLNGSNKTDSLKLVVLYCHRSGVALYGRRHTVKQTIDNHCVSSIGS